MISLPINERTKSKKNHLIEKISRFAEKLENAKLPWFFYLLFFVIILITRNLFESVSTQNPITFETFLEYNIFYVTIFLSLLILFCLLAKTKPLKTAKVIIPFFSLIILAPLVDLLLSNGTAQCISYIYADNLKYANPFLLLLSNFPDCGITTGIKVEGIVILFFIFSYLLAKTKSLLKSIAGAVIFYYITTVYAFAPIIENIIIYIFGINPFLLSHDISKQILNGIYLVLCCIQLAFLGLVYYKNLFKAIVFDLRLSRIFHFVIMFFLGVIIALKSNAGIFTFDILPALIFFPLSIFFAILFSAIINNIADKKIDFISNPNRPLQSGVISEKNYFLLSLIFVFLSVIFSVIISFVALAFTLFFLFCSFAYSSNPLRLKRIPLFSKYLIGIYSLLLVLFGYYLISNSVNSFPLAIVIFFLTTFSLALNFIDIKDFKGDKAGKILTLPVLLGEKKAKQLIGSFFFLSYFHAILILNNYFLFIPAVALGVIQFVLINKKKYNEKPIMALYLLSIVVFVLAI